MDGKSLPQQSRHDFTDPFSAGQMVGMLVMLTYIEKNKGIPEEILRNLMGIAADNLQEYFGKPSEDIFLMIDSIINEMSIT